MDPSQIARIECMITGVLAKNVAGDPVMLLRRIEQRAGIKVAALAQPLVDRFLQGLTAELGTSLPEWKVKFLIGTLKLILAKQV
jgi:hypothetical protein